MSFSFYFIKINNTKCIAESGHKKRNIPPARLVKMSINLKSTAGCYFIFKYSFAGKRKESTLSIVLMDRRILLRRVVHLGGIQWNGEQKTFRKFFVKINRSGSLVGEAECTHFTGKRNALNEDIVLPSGEKIPLKD
jgi:hypothetical protein